MAGNIGAATSGGNPFDNLTSLAGAGLATYNQQQYYANLQKALQTIGPTQLSSNQLSGPGGMTTGYNPTSGAGSINLGGLNPAFAGFSSAAGTGAGGYNASLPYGLSNVAGSTLNPALSNLFSAYNNSATGMGAANTQLGNLGNFNSTYNNLLQAQYGQLAPQIQQQAFGLQNTLFGNGVADSTGAASGSLAAQNFGRGVGQAQSTAQLNAFQQALAQQNSAAQNYGTLTNSANGILANAFQNFGGTNQLISGLNTAGLTNATTAAQGAGALNTVGLNNYNAGLQSSLAAAQARNMSLFPYASVATALSNTPNGMGMGANFLSQAGANGGFNIPGLNSLNNYYQSMFGGSPAVSAGDLSGYGAGVNSALSGFDVGGGALAADPTYAAALNMMGPSAAGGGAATAGTGAMTAGATDATANAAFDAYSASAAGDAAAGGAAADTAGGGAAAGGAGLALGAGAGALAGLYGLYMLDQANSRYSPVSAYNDLMTSSRGMSPSNAAAYQDIARRELNSPGNTGLFNIAGMNPRLVSGNKF